MGALPGVVHLVQGAGGIPSGHQAAPIHDAVDSIVFHSPLPDPIVHVAQFLFQQPPWLMAGGAIAAAIVSAIILTWLWRRRHPIRGWIAARRAWVQGTMIGGVALVVALAGLGAHKSFDYVMHDNNFCRGCHIFIPNGQPFVRPDTGTYLLVNALEGKHSKLSCHSCHPFNIEAQTKEMIGWILARPDVVPPHGKVPRAICEQCHERGDAKESWQQISATAGHRIHLSSDSAVLKNKVECLTCHARTAHRFIPADTTCLSAGCHIGTRIRLGTMQGAQTQMHCTLCHQFDVAVPMLAARDSASRLLIPGGQECTACHQMRGLVAAFDFTRDPHQARCGDCHDPHKQTRPIDAEARCAQCHSNWDKIPFHTGAAHRGAVSSTTCINCHQPHAARVDASDCTGCHREVRAPHHGEERLLPPIPFDTMKALNVRAPPPEVDPAPRGKGDAPPPAAPPPHATPSAADSFSHPLHRKLACLTCHDPRSDRKLTFEPPRGCQICHHQAPERRTCNSCHLATDRTDPLPLSVPIGAPGRAPTVRTVRFPHPRHDSIDCLRCHTAPVTLAADPVALCATCHDQHAGPTTDCTGCHIGATFVAAHAPPADAHGRCDGCHVTPVAARLAPTRNLCLLCHQSQQTHEPGRECITCHLPELQDRWSGAARK